MKTKGFSGDSCRINTLGGNKRLINQWAFRDVFDSLNRYKIGMGIPNVSKMWVKCG